MQKITNSPTLRPVLLLLTAHGQTGSSSPTAQAFRARVDKQEMLFGCETKKLSMPLLLQYCIAICSQCSGHAPMQSSLLLAYSYISYCEFSQTTILPYSQRIRFPSEPDTAHSIPSHRPPLAGSAPATTNIYSSLISALCSAPTLPGYSSPQFEI